MTASKPRRVRVDSRRVVRVVGDGLVALQGAYHGAAIPVLIVDSDRIPELGEAIRIAEFEPNGDVRSRWGTSGDAVLLHIELLPPVPTTFAVYFPLATQGIFVESALSAGVVEIKAGTSGSSFKSTFGDRGLVVEVPGDEEFPPWPTIFVRALMEHYRRKGLKALEARKAAEGAYRNMTSVARFRIGPSGDAAAARHAGDDESAE